MCKILIVSGTIFFSAFFPYITHARTFQQVAGLVIDLLNKTANFLMGMALLVFIIGVIRFIAFAEDDQARENGKQLMVWGTVVLFLMVAVWGIVEIIKITFFG